ncbi:MAG: hypothetical protein ACPF8V_08950 [Luteibaculum sp.]
MDQRAKSQVHHKNKQGRSVLLAVGTVLLVFSLSSCGWLKRKEKEGEVVARVNEKLLYDSELPLSIAQGLSGEDSIRVIKAYVEAWVKENVLVTKAKQNLSPELLDFEERIESYRNSLIVFEYERALVQERLDTAVSPGDIRRYYEENRANFMLQEGAYRFYYMGIQSENHDSYRVARALRSNDPVKLEELKAYGLGYGATFYFEDESWVLYSDLIQAIGVRYDKNTLNSGNPLKVLKQNATSHYLYILEAKQEGDIAPLNLVYEDIRSKIINDRKFKLITTMRNDLFNEALNKKDAEIYF